MKYLVNQKGAALVIVLTIVTVIMIVIPVLFYQVNTMATQFNQTERNLQADKLAKMGDVYFSTHVKNEMEKAELNEVVVDLTYLQQHFKFERVSIDGENNEHFEVRLLDIKSKGNNKFEISYESIGVVDEVTSTMQNDILITVQVPENNDTTNDDSSEYNESGADETDENNEDNGNNGHN